LASPNQITVANERDTGVRVDGIRVWAGTDRTPVISNAGAVSLTVNPLPLVDEVPTAQATTPPASEELAVTLTGTDAETPAAGLRYTIASLYLSGC